MFCSLGESYTFNNSTLIVPAVGIGNVGQLAIDAILSTMNCKRIGFMQSPHVLPIAGLNALDTGLKRDSQLTLSVNLEVYQLEGINEEKIFIMQQRARCIKGREVKFAKDILEWSKVEGFKNVIVLGGSESKDRLDNQMNTQVGQVEYLTNRQDFKSILSLYGFQRLLSLDERNSKVSALKCEDPCMLKEESESHFLSVSQGIRSGGLTKAYCQAAQEIDIPLLALIMFVSEGNNTQDGVRMAVALNTLLEYKEKEMNWVSPLCWRALNGRELYDYMY